MNVTTSPPRKRKPHVSLTTLERECIIGAYGRSPRRVTMQQLADYFGCSVAHVHNVIHEDEEKREAAFVALDVDPFEPS